MSGEVIFIVTCTNRKRRTPTGALRLGKVRGASYEDRFRSWERALRDSKETRSPASDLYCGNSWHIIKKARDKARAKNLRVETWVCSAGLGLVPFDQSITPYSATFAPGLSDSVWRGSDPDDRRDTLSGWWRLLCRRRRGPQPHSLSRLAQARPHAKWVVAASASYVEAIGEDLLAARGDLDHPENLLLISAGSRESGSLADNLAPSDVRLEGLLGGIRSTWNASLALWVMSQARAADLSLGTIRRRLSKELERIPIPAPLNRRRMTDDQISRFIVGKLRRNRISSASALLRELRDSGRACEQKRFGSLFAKVRGNINGT